MTCLKCGRESDQTFCKSCRDEMEKYPVKPGTVIQLPQERRSSVPRHTITRSKVTAEMLLERQKVRTKRLAIVVAALAVLIAAMGYAIFRMSERLRTPPIGQNYSVTKPAEETTDTNVPRETSEMETEK